MSEPVIYPLKHPVQLTAGDGTVTERITELRLSRLKGRDMRVIDGAKGQGAVLMTLLGRSAALPPSTVDELDAEDAADAGVIVMGFIGGALPTGAT